MSAAAADDRQERGLSPAGPGAWARDGLIAVAVTGLAALVVASAVQTLGEGRHTAPPLTRLRRDPLDLPALRDLALERDRRGDSDRAEAMFDFVGRRTWRDPPTLGRLLSSRAAEGRLTEAMEIADAALRLDGADATRPVLFPALIAAAGDPQARTALEARLALSPPWRGDFLRAMAAADDATRAASVFAALATGPAPPTPAEYSPFVGRLVEARDYAAAAAAWRDIARRPAGAGTTDGDEDFAAPADGTPFTWRPADGVGASSDVVPASDDAGRPSLRVDYDGYSSPTLPARLLVLAPGRWRIGWRERFEGAGATALYWRLRCADTGEVLAREPQAAAADGARGEAGAYAGAAGSPWRAQSMDAQTPAGVCGGQWLELVAVPGERRAQTTAWYESLRVAPAS